MEKNTTQDKKRQKDKKMTRAHVAFDLEMDGDKILCGSTWTVHSSGRTDSCLWTTKKQARVHESEIYENLDQETIVSLVVYLAQMCALGYDLVTWGGAAADWRVLYLAVPALLRSTVVLLTLQHIDVPLIPCSSLGMIMGLSAACVGMEIAPSAPTLLTDSSKVPAFWQSGELPNQLCVLQHVAADAMQTSMIYGILWTQAQTSNPVLSWMTQRKQRRSVRITRSRNTHERSQGAFRLPSVQECLAWPRPKTSFQIPSHLERDFLTKWLTDALHVDGFS